MTPKLLLFGGFNRSCYNLQPPWQMGADEQLQRCCRWGKKQKISSLSIQWVPIHVNTALVVTQLFHNSLSNWNSGLWLWEQPQALPLPCPVQAEPWIVHKDNSNCTRHGWGWSLPAEIPAEPPRNNQAAASSQPSANTEPEDLRGAPSLVSGALLDNSK